MGLIQEYVDMKISTYNIDHYHSKGYKCINGETIKIKVQDLSKGSGVKIDVQCDYCGEIFQQSYRRYLEHPNDIACKKCRYNKVAKTNLERYGCTCSLRNEEVLEKSKATNLNKFGVEYPLQNKQILQQTKETLFQRYGVHIPIHSDVIYHKMNETLKNNSNCDSFVGTSKIQKYLCELYNGILNYKIENAFVDIFIPEYNICCEYDGGGHNLSVIHNRITQEELDKKDEMRNKKLVDMGYKVFRIVSRKDKNLTDNEFLQIKNKAIDNLINNYNNIYIYDIDNQSEKSFKM